MTRLGRTLSTLLVVEDSDEDFEAISRILRKLGWVSLIERCSSGYACLERLKEVSRGAEAANLDSRTYPSLILLDLNMPGLDGREALREIKTNPRFNMIPVTVLTTSANPHDVLVCYAAGANAYVQKSLEYDEWEAKLRVVYDFWLHTVVLPTLIP